MLIGSLDPRRQSVAQVKANAERLWEPLSQPPRQRTETELYDLRFHAEGVLEPAGCWRAGSTMG